MINILMILASIDDASIYYPLDKTRQFGAGQFEINAQGGHVQFTQCRQSNRDYRPKENAFVETVKADPSSYEHVLRRVHGQDGRKRVPNPEQWPYCIHGHMLVNGRIPGSCTLVGAHHCLTAAHVVYNLEKKEWAKNITIYFGLDNNDETGLPIHNYPPVEAVGYYLFKKWVSEGDDNYDMAVIILKESIGYNLGWAGLVYSNDGFLYEKQIEITGYPVVAPNFEKFRQMWTMSHQVHDLTDKRITHIIDTESGQSGASIWINLYGNPFVVGVHTDGTVSKKQLKESGLSKEELLRNGDIVLDSHNYGARLCLEKFTQIVDWIRQTQKQTVCSMKVCPFTSQSRVAVVDDAWFEQLQCRSMIKP